MSGYIGSLSEDTLPAPQYKNYVVQLNCEAVNSAGVRLNDATWDAFSSGYWRHYVGGLVHIPIGYGRFTQILVTAPGYDTSLLNIAPPYIPLYKVTLIQKKR